MSERIGNCRILGEIGSGGMAVVYRAVQEPLGRQVAVKRLKPSIALDSKFAERFEREAHFLATLQHENILHIYDFIHDGKSMSIVMEYVEGIDLYDLLERTPVLPPEVAAIIALQVARALDYAHFRGVIHRDIKPANIIIARQGVVKLMDFGIARTDELSDLTETGTGLGTPSYMSPEQILGNKLDFRTDIFSLGIVLYQMVTGRKPFVEDTERTVMQRIRLDDYTAARRINAAVPVKIERIVARCLQKIPANRYGSTQALVDDLVEFIVPRVPMNHNARLVLYLRDAGLLPREEANAILSAGEQRGAARVVEDPSLLRHVGIVEGVLLAAVLIGGGVIQALADDRAGAPPPAALTNQTATVAAAPGYVRVVAEPWAEVFVDGEHVATTPSAWPIAVPPGRHFVIFRNPFYDEVQREVTVKSDETTQLAVQLLPRVPSRDNPPPQPPDAEPSR